MNMTVNGCKKYRYTFRLTSDEVSGMAMDDEEIKKIISSFSILFRIKRYKSQDAKVITSWFWSFDTVIIKRKIADEEEENEGHKENSKNGRKCKSRR